MCICPLDIYSSETVAHLQPTGTIKALEEPPEMCFKQKPLNTYLHKTVTCSFTDACLPDDHLLLARCFCLVFQTGWHLGGFQVNERSAQEFADVLDCDLMICISKPPESWR